MDTLHFQFAEIDFDVTRLHSKVDAVKRLQAEVARSDPGVKKKTVLLPDAANIRDNAVEGAYKESGS